MDLFIAKRRALGAGCCIGDHVWLFFVCYYIIICLSFWFALNCLNWFALNGLNCSKLLLSVNCAKPCCFAIGPGSKVNISDMYRGNDNIAWCNTFRYLGITFVAGRKLCANTV